MGFAEASRLGHWTHTMYLSWPGCLDWVWFMSRDRSLSPLMRTSGQIQAICTLSPGAVGEPVQVAQDTHSVMVSPPPVCLQAQKCPYVCDGPTRSFVVQGPEMSGMGRGGRRTPVMLCPDRGTAGAPLCGRTVTSGTWSLQTPSGSKCCC